MSPLWETGGHDDAGMSAGEKVLLACAFAVLFFLVSCASVPPVIMPADPSVSWISAGESNDRLICVEFFTTADPLMSYRCLTLGELRTLMRWRAAN